MNIYKPVFFALLFCSTVPVFAQSDARVIEIGNYKEVLKLFDEIGYTAENWQAGIREVPRIEITRIPKRWQQESSHIPVKDKKNVFFRLAGPGVLLANEKITADRKQLLNKIKNNKTADDQWLLKLAKKYRVISEDDSTLDKKALDSLVNRVDIIPPSLALAQAAEESGWGSSRFSIEGNALFGQWDFSGNGIKPKDQRKGLGDYGIAQFDSPQQSVEAYFLNLNTHRAYKKLRDKRASMRKNNTMPSGWELAKTLDKYSERGADYVKSLHNIIRYNKLQPADGAYLWSKGKIILKPAP